MKVNNINTINQYDLHRLNINFKFIKWEKKLIKTNVETKLEKK